ncbi:diphosphomevalonate decarboxylase [Chondromyces apiculatus]|uniref:diphosphomevalonate decarboxylase n=1 Tax=Chondromyces apiculatus DSM 436 TaxID=1192034 RepID=A0A017T0J4_9BACT|nr:diphosphomevalonate decarboxylase [Chondromyces apiculatus]EYF02779.1 Diphosphomevalonate decarboxylase [Chondromyces apiculatus DSM 436]
MSITGRATAVAHPNIALAKYWGKRRFGHNLPAVPSLSVTLAGLSTLTTVEFDDTLTADELHLGGRPAAPGPLARVTGLLDRVRAATGRREHARVVSHNDFPTAAGLASSASAFAALAFAASAATGLSTAPDAVSDLARRTSVSAARSAYGGFVALRAGEPADEVLPATPIAPEDHWPLRVIIAVTAEGPKDVGSSEGMKHTVDTSPYFPAWVDDAPALYARIHAAVLARDIAALGAAAEASALRMHASAIAADPGLLYWTGPTVAVLTEVRRLRARGTPAFFTIDAGPHVKVFTLPEAEAEVTATLLQIPGVLRTISAKPGGGARLDGG